MTSLSVYTNYEEDTFKTTFGSTDSISYENILVNEIIDELVVNSKFIEYTQRLDRSLERNPNKFINLSAKYKRYLK